jgi:Pilus formation protein N terminal region
MTGLCARVRANRRPWHWLSAVLLLTVFAVPATAADPIAVPLDQARILHLPDRATTIVVGNPLIADLSIQPGGLAIITGKSYGSTNFVVLDRSGVVLTEKNVEVTVPSEDMVVVYRGGDRETYSCTPECSGRLTLGDTTEFFDKTLQQITTRNAQAAAAGAMASGR